MKPILEIRRDARYALRKNGYKFPFWASVVYAIFTITAFVLFCCCLPDDYRFYAICGAFILFLLIPISCYYTVALGRLARGDEDVEVINLFDFFENGAYWRTIGLFVLKNVLLLLWSVLLVIPGIIMYFAFSLCYFVAYDHPELNIYQCIKKSRKLVKGHILQLILLNLTFIPLFVFSVFTCCIGYLWAIPFHQIALAKFYNELVAEEELKLAEIPSEKNEK